MFSSAFQSLTRKIYHLCAVNRRANGFRSNPSFAERQSYEAQNEFSRKEPLRQWQYARDGWRQRKKLND
jgi:hypothetical protein